MAMISADGLSLLVGDGQPTEQFTALPGARLIQLDVIQEAQENRAVATDAWAVASSVTQRRAVIELEALATDVAAAARVRSLALFGGAGNFRLETKASEVFAFAAWVTRYREHTDAGALKVLRVQLSSTGSMAIA